MVTLRKLGIGKEDQELLEKRLFPEVNEIFLRQIAKEHGYDEEDIPELDYSDNPTYVYEQWKMRRVANAKQNKKFPK